MRRLALSGSLAVVVGLLSSCGGGGGGSSGTGQLTVNITVPSPASASVTVTGPGGYSTTLTATETLTGLKPGSYTVWASSSRVAGAVVSTIYDGAVTGNPATVSNGATATASVTYTLRGGTGRLWVSDKNRLELQGYTAAQLAASGSPTPDVAVGTGAGTQTFGIAVGPGGALWVALPGGSTHQIARYDPSQLAASGTPTPVATLDTGSRLADRLVFDSSGNMWVDFVPSSGAPTVVRYAAADLAGTGALSATPALSWLLPSTGFSAKLTFDASGNLWIVNSGDDDTHPAAIMRADASTLGATGTPTFVPAATITSASVFYVQGVAFDDDGSLWIAVLNATGATPAVNLVRYAKSQLAVTGAQVVNPEAVFTVTGAVSLGSLAFDEAGDLWLGDYWGRMVSHLARSAIVASGPHTVAPDIVINTPTAVDPGIPGLVFDPPPLGLPLAQ